MKKLLLFCLACGITLASLAQAPREQFSYQGVARDNSGKALSNQNITLRFSIIPFLASPVYVEKHQTTTNNIGIFNLNVGGGEKISGDFYSIDWVHGAYFLKVEMDITGSGNYIDLGSAQLQSVPYSIYSAQSSRWKHNDPVVQNGAIDFGAVLNTSGVGSKLVWYPRNAAFRAGSSQGDEWNSSDIGIGSAAFGISSSAKAYASSAFGLSSAAEGAQSFAAGNKSKAKGEAAISLGHETQANLFGSVALGAYSLAIAQGAFAAGYKAEASGEGAGSVGYQTLAAGQSSFAAGRDTKTIGNYGIAAGNKAQAIGEASVAMGNNVVAKAFGSTTFGAFNNVQDNPNGGSLPQSSWTDRIFQIGNGTGEAALSNAITVLRNGRVGIGNGAVYPQYILEIDGRPRIRHNGATAGIFLNTSQQEPNAFVGMANDKEVGFFIGNNWMLTVDDIGKVRVNGVVIQTSDRRLKRDFTSLSNSLSTLTNLNGYHYYWKSANSDQSLQTGLIAQEVEEIFPELVSTDKDGMKAVNYIGLIPHLIEAIKELKTENDYLKKSASRISELEASVADLLKIAKAGSNVEETK